MFNLNIRQTTNPAPENVFNIGQALLNNLGPFTLNGVTVSDIHFVEYGDGWYGGSKWTNPEGGTSTLKIVADFTSPVAAPPVPEPSTWAMMILGFAGASASWPIVASVAGMLSRLPDRAPKAIRKPPLIRAAFVCRHL